MPFLKIVPTNGVALDGAEGMEHWFAAGAWAAGFVAALFNPADIAANRWSAIEHRARAIVDRAAALPR
jgi:2-keto-3-deoxy-6-phosphogluconate aldolase